MSPSTFNHRKACGTTVITDTGTYNHCTLEDTSDTNTLVTDSSDMTCSNLPGPGRGIGKLYSKAGKALERLISRAAHKLGYGPEAIARRISIRIRQLSDQRQKSLAKSAGGTHDQVGDKRLNKLCRKILKHSQYAE